MYNINRDTYTCDFCGFEEGWEDSDDIHGTMWICENEPDCGHKHFCTKCFVDRFGSEAYGRMIRTSDHVLCPDCYAKHISSSDSLKNL